MKPHGEMGDTAIRLEALGIGQYAQKELDRLTEVAKKTWYINAVSEDFTAMKEHNGRRDGVTIRTLWGRPIHSKKESI